MGAGGGSFAARDGGAVRKRRCRDGEEASVLLPGSFFFFFFNYSMWSLIPGRKFSNTPEVSQIWGHRLSSKAPSPPPHFPPPLPPPTYIPLYALHFCRASGPAFPFFVDFFLSSKLFFALTQPAFHEDRVVRLFVREKKSHT